MANSIKLFNLQGLSLRVDVFTPYFLTPFGRIELSLEVSGVIIPPAAVYAHGEQSVTVWADPTRVEILMTRPPIDVPKGMAVADAVGFELALSDVIAAVWRKGKGSESKHVVLKCVWAFGATYLKGGPNDGQYLNAQTWDDGRTKISLGLTDHEDESVTYLREGFAVDISALRLKQGHFACAWGPLNPDNILTWNAVDWNPLRLLPRGV